MNLREHDVTRLYQAVARRRSIRAYDGRPLTDQDYQALLAVCRDLPGTLAEGARVVLVTCLSREVFTGLAIKDAPAFLGIIAREADPAAEVRAGYAGEFVVLAATAAGLGTCWVTATYRPERAAEMVGLQPGERLFAVSPLGYPGRPGAVESFFNVAVTRSRERKPLAELVDPAGLALADAPAWACTAVDAARLAPSAYNRQPWRFLLSEKSVAVAVATGGKEVPSASRAMDCGMALLHLELGARATGTAGEWELLTAPGVARYRLPG